MASFGHFAVGAALGRASGLRDPRATVAVTAGFSALAMVPDADVVGVWLGLPDSSIWGHRGYSHSLLFAALVAVLVGLVTHRLKGRAIPMTVLAFATLASHCVLDALTYDTRGVPLWWPFSDERFAFSWRPIPPAPTGLEFLSARGIHGFFIEAIYFAPLVLYVFVPVRRRLAATRSVARATLHSGFVAATVLLCLALADLALRDWGPVAALERPGARGAGTLFAPARPAAQR